MCLASRVLISIRSLGADMLIPWCAGEGELLGFLLETISWAAEV